MPRINPLMAPPPGREPEPHDIPAEDSPDSRGSANERRRPDAAEHERLLRAAGFGDQEARDSLTRAHLDWVIAAARERAGRGLSEGDLFQEGTIGLLEAIEGFQSSGQTDFEPYARARVAVHMERALGDEERAVQDGKMLVQAAEDFQRVEVATRGELGRAPTDVELAEKLEWSVERTSEIRQMVEEARRRHDEELLQYLEDVDVENIVERRQDGDAG
jgi:RNA polymerase sigma factor (sigma-70 family)